MTILTDTREPPAASEQEELPRTTAVVVSKSPHTDKTLPTLFVHPPSGVASQIMIRDDNDTTFVGIMTEQQHQQVPAVQAVPLEEQSPQNNSSTNPTTRSQTVHRSPTANKKQDKEQQTRNNCFDDCCCCCYFPQHPFCCDYNAQASCCHRCTGVCDGFSLIFMNGFTFCSRMLEGCSDWCDGGCCEGMTSCCESGCCDSGCECCCTCLSSIPT